MKNRSILYFLAIGALAAAPVLADRIPDAFMEHESKSVSTESRANEHMFRGAANGHSLGLGALRESNPASQLRDFDEDGRLAFMNVRSSAGSSARFDELDSLRVVPVRDERFEWPGAKDAGRPHPTDADHEGASLPPVVVTEPESFTLLLAGVSVLGLLLYRRKLQ